MDLRPFLVDVGTVSGAVDSEAAAAPQVTTFAGYMGVLAAIAKNEAPSAELKAQYRSAKASFGEHGQLRGIDIEPMLNAEKAALVAIARAELRESGKRVPSDKDLESKIAKALDAAAKAQSSWLEVGTEVRTQALQSAAGMLVADKFLTARRAGELGTLEGYFPGHGGDVWAVKHADGTVGAYSVSEMRPTQEPKAKSDVFTG